MKKVKRWRYYCNHCNKSGGSGGHMKHHEKSCTKNPDRVCGLCKMAEIEQKPSKDIKTFLEQFIVWDCWSDDAGVESEPYASIKNEFEEKTVLEKLREFVDGCPACMLTAMRLLKCTGCFGEFKFKNEKASFYKECIPEPEYYY